MSPEPINAMFMAMFSRLNTVPGIQYMLNKQTLFTQRKGGENIKDGCIIKAHIFF